MKPLRYLIGALLLLAGCRNNNGDNCHTCYPKRVDSLGIQKLYDETKWHLYCYYCDDTAGYNSYTNEKITYGTLELLFDTCEVRKDTVLITFRFNFPRKNVVKYNDVSNKRFSHYDYCGVVYIHDTIYAFYGHTFNGIYREFRNPESYKSKYFNPLQPDVLRYINLHKNDINPWFRAEAIKRGVLNDK